MNLNDRKTKILEAIIHDYIATADPIGSRTIAKKYDLGISSATIRNEMSDLEEMGLIVQPHASAGRVPSDKGYRLYVDKLMQKHVLTEEESLFLKQVVSNNINQIDYLMKETAKAIALLTKYTTVVSEPETDSAEIIKHLQLVPLDEKSLIFMIISEGKTVRNTVVRQHSIPDCESLNRLSSILNSHLAGLTIDKISKDLLTAVEGQFGEYAHMAFSLFEALITAMNEGNDMPIYTSGIKNILAFPEFSDLDKARAIFQTLEEKDMLITLFGNGKEDNIQIVIGAENNLVHMQDCSIIKTSYRIGSRTLGSIGILGPTRMDYPQVVSVLSAISYYIKSVMHSIRDG